MKTINANSAPEAIGPYSRNGCEWFGIYIWTATIEF